MTARSDTTSARKGSNPSERTGINVVAHIGAHAGLGIAARSFMRALMEQGHPVSVLDVDYGLRRAAADIPSGIHRAKGPEDLPHKINLICVSIQHLPALLWRRHPGLLDARFFNAPLVFWELPLFPPLWARALGLCDALLACSPFVQMALRRQLPHLPTVYAEYPLFLPDFAPASRAALGIPESAVVFGTSFDLGGDPARKNPAAVVRAFRTAFPGAEDVCLLIKGNGSLEQASGHPELSQIQEAARTDSRIRFIAVTMPYDEVLGLYAACDAYVSLHRAEGLGLGPMEAMALGKPVVATGYSGNMGYMNDANSFPIRYQLIPTAFCSWHYSARFVGAGACWADADVEQAAEVMRRLAGDPSLRLRIGANARRDIEARQATAHRAEFAGELATLAAAARRAGGRSAGRWKLLLEDLAHPLHVRMRLRRLFAK